MIPIGIKSIVAFNTPLQYTIGVPWEYIRLRNESDNECIVTFTGAGSATLGAWVQDDFYVGKMFTGQITITPLATPTSSTVATGFITGNAYAQGELKNPGSIMLVRLVQVTSVAATTLSNEGGAIGATVVDIGDSRLANLIVIHNDGSMQFNVDQGGVSHVAFFTQTTVGQSAFIIGQSGDKTQCNGQFQVNHETFCNADLYAAAAIRMTNTNPLVSTDASAVSHNIINTDVSNNLNIASVGGNIQFYSGSNVLWATMASGVFSYGVSTSTISFKSTDGKSLIDFTTVDTYVKAINGKFNFQGDGLNTDWTRAAESRGTGTSINGALTVTHNLKFHNGGVTPDIVIITPTQNTFNGILYVTTKTTTQFTLNATAAWTFDWYCIRFT